MSLADRGAPNDLLLARGGRSSSNMSCCHTSGTSVVWNVPQQRLNVQLWNVWNVNSWKQEALLSQTDQPKLRGTWNVLKIKLSYLTVQFIWLDHTSISCNVKTFSAGWSKHFVSNSITFDILDYACYYSYHWLPAGSRQKSFTVTQNGDKSYRRQVKTATNTLMSRPISVSVDLNAVNRYRFSACSFAIINSSRGAGEYR